MGLLYKRNVALTVTFDDGESLRWDDLRISFDVTHTNNRDPSPGTFTIWNLSPQSRGRFKRAVGVSCDAGYDGRYAQVFIGRVTRTETRRHPVDTETIIYAADGIDVLTEKKVNLSLNPGTPYTLIFDQLHAALGVGVKYVDYSLLGGQTFSGVAFSGPVGHYLDQLAQRFGATWTIQDGQLRFQRERQPDLTRAVLVTPQTGLVGSPEELTRKRSGGRVKVIGLQWTMLLQGEIRPGQLFQVKTQDFDGYYVAQKVTHKGDNGWDNDYYTGVEAVEKETVGA